MMKTTKLMRRKYGKRKTTSGKLRYPPGGEDMMRMCNLCDELEIVIGYAQYQLPPDRQKAIEIQLRASKL